MIILAPDDIQAKRDGPPAPSPTPSLRVPPPPVHPALHYGVSSSAVSPPGYQSTRKPLTSISYTFWPQAVPSSSMILAPPSNLENPGPSFCISVNMNCFTPTSYITTVKRGSWDGELVGDFQIGLAISKKFDTVCVRGNEFLISDIFKPGHQRFRSSWTWKTPEHDKPVFLYWDDSVAAGVITCFASKDKTAGNVLARFIPPRHLRKLARPAEMHRLEVSPQGHEYFDDILMSALILERLRTLPSV
ncbi:hypothetical protein D9615_001287 [Tricholomella constricta]|uniref:DUF6593 domain-containing protein n=1 Tax=Tricholomella constricta TaxID=117010 RepID=A0A8H5HKV9_9AGAR|nr:hypothetical protein D9615_001287 [Tricholomella constricta]